MTVFFLLERELAMPKTLTFHYCFLNYRYFYVDVADGSAATVIPSFLVGLFFLAAFMPGSSDMHPARGFKLYD